MLHGTLSHPSLATTRYSPETATISTNTLYAGDTMSFVPKMCEAGCRAALEEAYAQLSDKCSAADSFIMDNYDGIFSAE